MTLQPIFQVLGVANGLEYLHSRGVVHGDVKPVGISSNLARVGVILTDFKQNILVSDKGDACLADFGLSVVIRNKSSTGGKDREARGHSTLWVAPETLKGGQISKETDVFCYSLVALEVRSSEN